MIGDDQLMSNASLVKILVQNRKKMEEGDGSRYF